MTRVNPQFSSKSNIAYNMSSGTLKYLYLILTYWLSASLQVVLSAHCAAVCRYAKAALFYSPVDSPMHQTCVRGSKSPKSTISPFLPCDIQHIYIIAVSIRDIAYYNPFMTSWTSPSLSIKFCQYISLYRE